MYLEGPPVCPPAAAAVGVACEAVHHIGLEVQSCCAHVRVHGVGLRAEGTLLQA
jgi:hypothetical protein